MKLLQSADVFSHAKAFTLIRVQAPLSLGRRRKEGEGFVGVGYNFGRSKLVQFVSCLMSSIPTTEELLEQLKVLVKGLDAWKVEFSSSGT